LEPADLWVEADGEHGRHEDQQEYVANLPGSQGEHRDPEPEKGNASPIRHRREAVIGHVDTLPLGSRFSRHGPSAVTGKVMNVMDAAWSR
jgi:hypothetical protein